MDEPKPGQSPQAGEGIIPSAIPVEPAVTVSQTFEGAPAVETERLSTASQLSTMLREKMSAIDAKYNEFVSEQRGDLDRARQVAPMVNGERRIADIDAINILSFVPSEIAAYSADAKKLDSLQEALDKLGRGEFPEGIQGELAKKLVEAIDSQDGTVRIASAEWHSLVPQYENDAGLGKFLFPDMRNFISCAPGLTATTLINTLAGGIVRTEHEVGEKYFSKRTPLINGKELVFVEEPNAERGSRSNVSLLVVKSPNTEIEQAA